MRPTRVASSELSKFRAGGRILFVLVAWALVGAGCAAPWAAIDEKTPRPFTFPTLEVQLDLPIGWMSSYYAPALGYTFFTVHGAELDLKEQGVPCGQCGAILRWIAGGRIEWAIEATPTINIPAPPSARAS